MTCVFLDFLILSDSYKDLYFLQDIQNKNRRNPNIVMIEKKVDEFLQHWRARIGLQKQKQVDIKGFDMSQRALGMNVVLSIKKLY